MRHPIVLLLALLAAPVVVVLGSRLAGRYYYWSLAQSPSPSLSEERPVSGTSPQPTERTTASMAPAEETTALEETTAFQPPAGTRTSSTARIVCLRVDQGTPPPTKGTEALTRDVLTRVLTPKVAAHPDGVHLQADNRLGERTSYTLRQTSMDFIGEGSYIEAGKSNHVSVRPPGIADIKCSPPSQEGSPTNKGYAHFEIVAAESGYKSLALECKPGATPSVAGRAVVSRGGGEFDFVSYRDPVGQARSDWSKKLKKGDVVEVAGYPEDPDPPVRVVRNGKVVATIDYEVIPSYETYCRGQF